MFDEKPGSHEYPVWATLDSTSKYLFYVTANEQIAPFSPIQEENEDPTNLVPCQIKVSRGDNTTTNLPLKTKITMGYYQ